MSDANLNLIITLLQSSGAKAAADALEAARDELARLRADNERLRAALNAAEFARRELEGT